MSMAPPSYNESMNKAPLPQQPVAPPQPGFVAAMNPGITQQQTVILHQQEIFGRTPMRTRCTYCQNEVMTRTELVNTTKTHLIALLCCLVCCCVAPCVYCMDECKGALHYCPQCDHLIGKNEG